MLKKKEIKKYLKQQRNVTICRQDKTQAVNFPPTHASKEGAKTAG